MLYCNHILSICTVVPVIVLRLMFNSFLVETVVKQNIKDKSRNDIIINQQSKKDKLCCKITFHGSTSSTDFPICTSSWQMTLSPTLFWLQPDYSLMRNTQLQNTITGCRHMSIRAPSITHLVEAVNLPKMTRELFSASKFNNISTDIADYFLSNNNKISQMCWSLTT